MIVPAAAAVVVVAYRCSLPSARQHLSYGDCLEVKREYYQNSSVLFEGFGAILV